MGVLRKSRRLRGLAPCNDADGQGAVALEAWVWEGLGLWVRRFEAIGGVPELVGS